ncbi:MAG: hypothetical protein ABNH26_09315 [Celeribacter sp.]|jgi:hypothetical protein
MTDRHDEPALSPAAQARAEAELESLFAAARHSRADLEPATPDLLARILGDAEAEQDSREAERLRAATGASVGKTRSTGRWSLTALLRGIGGWPAAASLAAATMAGVWIGVDQPAGLDSVTGAFIGSETTLSATTTTAVLATETGSEDALSDALLGEYGFNAGWSAYEGILADG